MALSPVTDLSFRGDSVRVAQRWPEASPLVWHGTPHVFAGFNTLPEARQAPRWRASAQLRAAIAVLSALMGLAVAVLGLGPLLLRVHPLVWLAMGLFLRAGGGAGFGRRRY